MTGFWFTFLKFFTVGGLGFGIDMLSTWVLKEKMALAKFKSNTIGFIIGIVFRFFVNKLWTFQDTNPAWLKQILQFGGIALVGLGIVNGIIYLLDERFKLLDFYKAKVIAMIVFMLWNFSANYLWTFA